MMREQKFMFPAALSTKERALARSGVMSAPLLIEGYASLFGQRDASGDVVRAGAFARSLSAARGLPMLLQHRNGAVAGRWTRAVEDGRGLYVRGLIEAAGAQTLAAQGLDGLSIGFRATDWRPNALGGRDLRRVDLVEVSLVATPMLGGARFKVLGGVTEMLRAQRV